VLIIGNPFGLGHSVTRGAISGLDRRLELGREPLGGLIQVDAPLHPGDSGALVADLRGEWLGLIRSGLAIPDAERTHDHDLGFAIPACDALWVAGQLRTRGRVDRAYLGVRLDPGRSGDPPGARLDDVLDGTPAALAGLRPGDRVVALDGHAVLTPRDLTDRLDRTPAATRATLEYVRATQRDRLTILTAHRPPRERPSSHHKSNKAADESLPVSPRDLAERLERLQRRVEELEKRKQTAQSP
jgi:S1-C subfamily serine protease